MKTDLKKLQFCVVLFAELIEALCFKNIACFSKKGLLCWAFMANTECSVRYLERKFPFLFPKSNNKIWPGKPSAFNLTYANTAEPSLRVSWRPPLDSSIRDVRGFFISVTGVDGLVYGLHECIVVDLGNSTLNISLIQTEFYVIYPNVHTVSTYDFRIVSLPAPPPKLDLENNQLGRRQQIWIPKSQADKSLVPSEWTTTMVCRATNNKIVASFELPPRTFRMTIFRVTLQLLGEDNTIEDKSSLHFMEETMPLSYRVEWNMSDVNIINAHTARIMLMPVEIGGFQECTCYNKEGICMGGCKTSSCNLSISSSTTVTPSPNLTSLHDNEKYESMSASHVSAIVTCSFVLLMSLIIGILVFFCRNQIFAKLMKNNNDSNAKTEQSEQSSRFLDNNKLNNEDVRKSSPETPAVVSLNSLNMTKYHDRGIYDEFIKPSPVKETGSFTLSDQMLQINDRYIKALDFTPECSQPMCEESVSLGGKSV